MNKLLITILLILAITFSACGSNIPTEQETIKIGAILPLTGSVLVTRGIDSNRALQMAIDKVNFDGGINGKKLDLVVEDNQGSSDSSVTIMQRFLLDENKNIFYSLFTGPTTAITPLIIENDKFLIYQSTVFSMAEENSLICVDYWSFKKLGKEFAELAYEEGPHKIGVLRSQTEYGQYFEDSFVERANELGLNYSIETFKLSDLDVNTQITKFKSENVDLIISDGFENNFLNLFKSITSLDYPETLTLFGSSTIYDVSKLNDEIASNFLSKYKVVIAYHDIDNMNVDLKKFIDEWKTIYEKYPTTEAIYSYDDVLILSEILRDCDAELNITPECIYNKLINSNKNVLEGSLNINNECIFDRNLVFLTYKNGVWESYEN